MPTKSKKRRPTEKDGHVSYQHVSLAQPNVVLREVDYIVECAAQCDARCVTLGQLLFFSTDTGDAWMLEGDAFVVTDGSGQRVILGYPVRELMQAGQRTTR
jgi:hypothetical protein